MGVLDTGIKNVKNVINYTVGAGSISEVKILAKKRKNINNGPAIYFIDEFFKSTKDLLQNFDFQTDDEIIFVNTKEEPTTDYIDQLISQLRVKGINSPSLIIGMGGGITMDIAKAISNLYTNPGNASDYQGWDLVKNPGIFKIAIPTISGTGAEATRTCVMTNKRTGIKLGMNSDFTVYDQIIMDPDLTASVPRNQYFYTGMDAYIHCIESLSGSYKNPIGNVFSEATIRLCREIFLEEDMMSSLNREKLMVASYLGGCAIATSYVGLIHPFSAGLSVVLGTHHCVGNCIVMNVMDEFYPEECKEFKTMLIKQNVNIPRGVCKDLDEETFSKLYASTIIHEKPLTNALGQDYKKILTPQKVKEIFMRM